MEKAKPWAWQAFENPAREDGLVLRHWSQRRKPAAAALEKHREKENRKEKKGAKDLEGDEAMGDAEAEAEAAADEDVKDEDIPDLEYRFSKYNISPNIITYSDGEYEAVLRSQSEDWSREETDYLFSLCREFDLRFIIIADRYSYPGGKDRSMEDIKARYYSVCRSIMALRTPLGQMTPEEHNYYNLLQFDKEKEISRKKMAEALFNRTPEEIKEEEYLLIEMKRILANQEKLLEERQDLFNRLDTPQSLGSISAYSGSQGLQNLNLLMQNSDKSKKRKSIAMGANTNNANDLPPSARAAATANSSAPEPSPVVSTSAERASTSTSTPKDKDAPNTHKKSVRTLNPEEEKKFGVVYHEKLASGVYLRSSKIGVVKGASQPKVQTALHELGIPNKLTMSTVKTCAKMEQLNHVVNAVLDAKKHMEKLDQEIRVEKNRLEALGRGMDGSTGASVPPVSAT